MRSKPMFAIPCCLLQLILLVFLPGSSRGQEPAWEKSWNRTLAATKKEKTVVVAGPPSPVMRKELIPQFTARFGIPVEFIASRSAEVIGRARTERQAGIYSIDVFLSTVSSMSKILYPEKMLDPLKPILILPEVVAPEKWTMKKPWFIDPEEKYVLRVFRHVTSWLYINADFVKRRRQRSYRTEKLDPCTQNLRLPALRL